MAARPRISLLTVDTLTVEEVVAKDGIVVATLLVNAHDRASPRGRIRFRLDQEKAKELEGLIHGALIVAQTQIQRGRP
jgi:hypothetical protein